MSSSTERAAVVSDLSLFLADVDRFSRDRSYSADCINCDRRMVFDNGRCNGCGSERPIFTTTPREVRA